MRIRILAGIVAVAGLVGCASTGLRPAQGVNVVAGQKDAATAESANVRVTVRTEAWSAYPSDLASTLTPLEVTIDNRSGHPLSVRYRSFTLVGASGFRYAAIPPFSPEGPKPQSSAEPAREPTGELAVAPVDATSGDVHGQVVFVQHAAGPVGAPPPVAAPAPVAPPPMPAPPPPAPVHAASPVAPAPAPSGPVHAASPVAPVPAPGVHAASPVPSPYVVATPRFHYNHFYVAPFYSPYYPGLGVWAGPFLWDPLYYGGYYGFWNTWQTLPTRDMLELALPEGVLQDGGQVTGFLYFASVRSQPSVTFQANLVDANSNAQFGTVSIPLVSTH